jgi:energy-coupling factor transporter transmembrane protein EcfT
MAMALEARGFGMGATPTIIGDYRMRSRDAVALVALVTTGTIYFLLDLTGYGLIAVK